MTQITNLGLEQLCSSDGSGLRLSRKRVRMLPACWTAITTRCYKDPKDETYTRKHIEIRDVGLNVRLSQVRTSSMPIVESQTTGY